MPEPELQELEVGLRSVTLHDVSFELLPGDPKSLSAVEVKADLGTAWVGADALAVEIAFSIEPGTVFRFSTRYRGVFEAAPGMKPDLESSWRIVASRVAPSVLIPYIRETFSTLAQKAGLRNQVLPLINIGAMWQPEEIQLGPQPAASAVDEPAVG